ncbi:MAG: formate dehydrogenase subunit gamma [Rhodospirillales bacterium]|nr:formate dehydrogenase subunit gamma [Rhodospirillales bacterium]
MSDVELEPGDALHPGKPVIVDRYRGATRLNHWVTAISLVLLALSGLSMFHPSLFFLTAIFGGGQATRTIHPWIGVVLFFSFLLLFLQFWRLNLWNRTDVEWVAHAKDLVSGHEEKMPEVGKYNAGQKFIFWSMSILISILIVTGIMIWDEYFFDLTSIEVKRFAVLIHAVAAVIIILVWILHVYAGIWVRGSINSMITGSVSGGWAWRHHRKWLKRLAAKPANRGGPA